MEQERCQIIIESTLEDIAKNAARAASRAPPRSMLPSCRQWKMQVKTIEADREKDMGNIPWEETHSQKLQPNQKEQQRPVKLMDACVIDGRHKHHSFGRNRQPKNSNQTRMSNNSTPQAREGDERRKHHKKPGSHEDGTNQGEPGENSHRGEGQ